MKWFAKICVKIIVSRLPLSYSFWKKIGLIFIHGDMDDPQKAASVSMFHLNLAGDVNGKTLLELGPGDSLYSGIIAKSIGAEKYIAVDVGNFATRKFADYLKMDSHLLINHKLKYSLLIGLKSFEEMLGKLQMEYLTNGISDMKNIHDSSIDFVWSHTVLQHIHLNEFDEYVKNIRRIMKVGSLSSHQIDLRDMLGGDLNNLRFSNNFWNSSFFRKSGFYTNRLRCAEITSILELNGFELVSVAKRKFKNRIPKKNMNKIFQKFTDEELDICGFHILVRAI